MNGITDIEEKKDYNFVPFNKRACKALNKFDAKDFRLTYYTSQTAALIAYFEELVSNTIPPLREDVFFPDDKGDANSGRTGDEIAKNQRERKLEARIWQKYRKFNTKSKTLPEYLTHIPIRQQPLAKHGDKSVNSQWGNIDLVGCSPKGLPVIVELKIASSNETPLRIFIEGLAYAIGIQEMWTKKTFRNAWKDELGDGFPKGQRLQRSLKEITIVALAPDAYWNKLLGLTSSKAGRLRIGAINITKTLFEVASSKGYHFKICSVDESNYKISDISKRFFSTN